MVWRVSTQNWLEEACNENMPSSAVVGLSADSNLSAEIILSYASGEPGSSITRRLGITAQTVSRWRLRFSQWRPEGLNDESRSRRPAVSVKVQKVIDWGRQTKPEDAATGVRAA